MPLSHPTDEIERGLGATPLKISAILDKIDERQLFVPAFQREYVWKREDAKELLDSLIKEYPTGTMLTWETNQPPELKGPHQYDQKQGAVRILLCHFPFKSRNRSSAFSTCCAGR